VTQGHNRHSIRLKGYDYSQNGAYFVTICTQHRKCLFGSVINDVGAGPRACPNDAGKMIATVWNEIPTHYHGITLGYFVVMPNHFHGIIEIVGAGPRACPNDGQPTLRANDGQPQGVAPTTLSLPDVVHRFKTLTTKRYTDGVKQNGWMPFDKRLWQRNYYEHIIRTDDEYHRISEYIINNPMNWRTDTLWTNSK
jgi:REP element-mobilizing transposase RayT